MPLTSRPSGRPLPLRLGVIGPGKVGSSLLDQISEKRDWLRHRSHVDLHVVGVANTTSMLLMEEADYTSSWRQLFDDPTRRAATDLKTLMDHVLGDPGAVPVMVDCTADEEIASTYGNWLDRGIHVVTPNKRAGSGDFEYYRELQVKASLNGARYLYETTVGAALPILRTIREMSQAGDPVRRIEGVLSGSLSYVFGRFDESTLFSDMVLEAHRLGYTEPDPREDLSGLDMARKTVILGRETGSDVSLDQVDVENLVPPKSDTSSDWVAALTDIDEGMTARMRSARARGHVVRLVGVVDKDDGCNVAVREYDADHPFARVRGTDNIVQINSSWYDENPLIIQGPGAGPRVNSF